MVSHVNALIIKKATKVTDIYIYIYIWLNRLLLFLIPGEKSSKLVWLLRIKGAK